MVAEGCVLVLGGAGYIGSHTVLSLIEASYRVAVVDDFSAGQRAIAQALGVEVLEGDIGDEALIAKACKEFKPVAAMHFAAYAIVRESMSDPGKYYVNNVQKALTLLRTLLAHGVNYFIFSSTCATYGIPASAQIDELTPQRPINPYGRSKLMFEQILKDYEQATALRTVIFRYFNAAGAHPSGRIGEWHVPETHLIPLAMRASLGGKELAIFGNDYDTKDGTCVRDYVHVCDIAQAHLLGLQYLLRGGKPDVFNLGSINGLSGNDLSGNGISAGASVLDVVRTVEEVTGLQVPYHFEERAAGDPPRLVASAEKAQNVLGWNPQFPALNSIVESAWRWHARVGNLL